MASPATEATPAPPEVQLPQRGLSSASFLGLLVTQFLGALNDNIFRWLASYVGRAQITERYGAEHADAALSLGATCLVLPFILFAAPAGYLADRFSKRTVIVWCKVAEVVLMLLGAASIYFGELYLLFVIVFLMGAQSALFGPSKLGSLPEMLHPGKLPSANGLIGLTTVLAVIAGSVLGAYLYELTAPDGNGGPGVLLSGGVIVGVAVAGWLASLFVAPLPAMNAARNFPWNPILQTWRDLAVVASSRPLLRVALGSAFFWSLGGLAQLNITIYGADVLALDAGQTSWLLAILALGIGLGSVLAGLSSQGRVELGLVPLGAMGITLFAFLLFTVPELSELAGNAHPIAQSSFRLAALYLFLLGAAAGLYDIPLNAYLQHRSPADARGSVLAASNFLTFTGVLLVSGMFWVLRAPLRSGEPLCSPQAIFLIAAILTAPVAFYALVLLPQATIRLLVWLLSLTLYRVRVVGRENLPATGGALLIPNHVTWIDGVLLLLTSSRPVRMVAYADYLQGWWVRGLAKMWGVIPIVPGRRSVIESLRVARAALAEGDLVCIFPEGALTRTGQVQSFKPGFLSILKDTGAPVVPVYLDGLWGSIFSFKGGKFFWKWPERWPYPVSILFGPPLEKPSDPHLVRQAVLDLGSQAVELRKSRSLILPRLFLRNCRKNAKRGKVADATSELTGRETLLRTLIIRRVFRREVLARDEKHVGVLLPPTVAGVLANAALALDGRVSVNLNYTVSADVLNSCIRQAGLKHVITSRRVREKLQLALDCPQLDMEDLRDKVRTSDKLFAWLAAYLCPVWLLERWLGLTKIRPDDVLTLVFTSGSTGEPKGVMLTQHNVGSNIDGINQIIRLSNQDVLMGVLPFFHSMGYTATLWTVLSLDPKGVYHTNPLEARQVGELCKKHGANIIIATPTFLRSYLKRCSTEDFAKLEVVIAGAEKLPRDLCDAFEQKFKVRPVEGYGATELSPLVSVNVPPSRALDEEGQVSAKEGTVGRPIPGVTARIVDLDTGTELSTGQSGMLQIKGPNVMAGYLHRPDLTAKVIRDGWYVTGDVASIDADGFITITGRESRFSKIGGEMVPHLLVEETLQRLLAPDGDEVVVAVTAVPDARKGERLIVLHKPLAAGQTVESLCQQLAAAGLPNLWIPSPDSFHSVDELPLLGSGKLDLKRVKSTALERFAPPAE